MRTEIYDAVRANNFSFLLELGDAIAPHANICLAEAANQGRLEICKWVHAKFGPVAKNTYSIALRLAAAEGHLNVCQWLHATFNLTAADVRANGNYAIGAAAANGHLPVCRWLYATFHLTEEDVRCNENRGMLLIAVQYGHLDACKWIHATCNLAAADWASYAEEATTDVAAWIRGLALRELAAKLTALADALTAAVSA